MQYIYALWSESTFRRLPEINTLLTRSTTNCSKRCIWQRLFFSRQEIYASSFLNCHLPCNRRTGKLILAAAARKLGYLVLHSSVHSNVSVDSHFRICCKKVLVIFKKATSQVNLNWSYRWRGCLRWHLVAHFELHACWNQKGLAADFCLVKCDNRKITEHQQTLFKREERAKSVDFLLCTFVNADFTIRVLFVTIAKDGVYISRENSF